MGRPVRARHRRAPTMIFMDLPRPLRGVIPAMITPLRGRDELDAAGLERLIDNLLAAGVHGLFPLGTTGEAPAISYRLREELIERTCRHAAGRVPVIVGITDTAFAESVRLAEHAAECGAQAVVASAPYYFPAAQEELLDYIVALAAEMPLPLFLYNAPTNTHHWFRPEIVARAATIPRIVGLKDSSADMVYFHSVQQKLKDRQDFTLLVGPEELMAEAVLLGGHGSMCGGANFYPKIYVDLYHAARDRDVEKVNVLQKVVMQISTTVYRVGPHDSSYLKGLKCAVSLMGICGDFMAEPFRAFGPTERAKVREHLLALGLKPGV